jgi:LysM repeat protein
MNNILKLTGCTLCLLIAQVTFAGVQDSIGVEKKENKIYVLHKVDPGESLYGLAKTYNVTVDEIKTANPGIANGLKVGQVIKVPYKGKTAATTTETTTGSTQIVIKKHKIQSGESLYSIADKYNTTITEIKKANPGMSSSIKAGQVINVPVKQTVTATTTPKPTPTQPSTSNQTTPTTTPSSETFLHTVTAGESLYSIARKYNVSVDEIKKVNPNMPSSIKVGQSIKIPGTAPKETITTPNTNTTKPTTTVVAPTTSSTNTTTTKPTTTAPVKVDSTKIERDRSNLQTTVGKPTITQPTSKPTTNGDFKKISESGNALLMADHQEDSKFLAYHKTAPVGTIIQVINDQNGQKIYVRVIGKLNDSDSKNVISLSKKAFERIGGTGATLKVDLMYIP